MPMDIDNDPPFREETVVRRAQRPDGRTAAARATRSRERQQFTEEVEVAPPRQRPADEMRRAPRGSMEEERSYDPQPRQRRTKLRTQQRRQPKAEPRYEVDEDTGEEFEYVRVPVRAHAREAHRDPVRQHRRGRAEVQGRNGERLTRKRTTNTDPFDISAEMIEPGWEMQWIAHTVHGNSEIVTDQNLQMIENGWRPVDAARFPGRFMPAGYKGHIIRGGQGLYERPKALSDEARAEEIAAAHQLITDRNESLQISRVRKSMGPGYEMSGKYRGTGGNIKIQMDRNLDMPKPNYQLADD